MTSFWRQTYYLLYRNLLLKRRNLFQLLQELVLPCVFIIAVVVFQNLSYERYYDEVKYDEFKNYKLLEQRTFLPEAGRAWAFTPNKSAIQNVMSKVSDFFGNNIPSQMLAFESEDEMVKAYYNKGGPSGSFDFGFVFSNDFPDNLTVVIRTSTSNVPSSSSRFGSQELSCNDGGCSPDHGEPCRNAENNPPTDNPFVSATEPGLRQCEGNKYLHNGFAALQVVFQNVISSVVVNESLPVPDYSVRMFPKSRFVFSTLWTRMLNVIYYVLMYAVFIAVLLTNLVYEKEKKIKESMLMMGMSDAAFWLAWFIIYAVIMLVVSLIVTLLSKFALGTLPKGNFLIVFLIMFLYGVSIISLSFMLTPFFNKVLVAGVASTLIVLVLALVYIPLALFPSTDNVIKWLLSFFSPVAVALAVDQALLLDIDGVGIQFDNCGLGSYPPYVAMLAIDTVLYLLLAVYFDNVIPGNYGQHKPPWFCFMPSYWCGRGGNATGVQNDVETVEYDPANDIELVSPEMRNSAGIRIRGLSKTFKAGKGQNIQAVKEMTLDIYEGQITCLLGHNGAGKTTLINTLTGLIPADTGQATIYGYSIRDPVQMHNIRAMMGVCSQDNTLFDTLSPREHLKVYAGMKGVAPSDIDSEVERILEQTQLSESASTKSKDLSGGQKRKLCVGIALIGDPKVLFLDEPSSGMDPFSRRQLWTLLKSQRQGRFMVLTTHFMDEADILADQKAVMSRGSLRCYGSSLFLKNRFGIGYHLGMVVQQNVNVDEITKLVMAYVPGGQVSRSHGMELAYTLPLQQANKFPELFRALEEPGQNEGETVARQLGIQSYGVSMTTLEEVFLKLNDEEVENEEERVPAKKSDMAPIISSVNAGLYEPTRENNGQEATSLDVNHLMVKPLQPGKYQIKALCKVLFLQMLRNFKTYVFRLLFPVLFMVVGAVLASTLMFDYVPEGDTGTLVFSPELYLESTSSSSFSMLTPLLYQNNLTGGEDINLLLGQFKRMKLVSDDITDVSDLVSVAPHSMAIVAHSLDSSGPASLLALYNDTVLHSLPVLFSILSNALVPLQTSSKTVLDMKIASHPFPETDTNIGRGNHPGFILAILLAFAITLLPLGFIIGIVKERQDKVRTQLRVSGVSMSSYWGSHFIIDAAQMYFIVIIAIIVSLAVGSSIGGTSLATGGGIFMLIIFMIIYVPLDVLFAYCMSFLFNEYKTCQSVGLILFIFLPMLLVAPTLIPDFMRGTEPDDTLPVTLHLLFSFFYPPYGVFGGLYYIDRIYQEAYLSETEDELVFGDYFAFSANILPTILCVLASLVVVFFLLRLLEIKSTGGHLKDVFMFRKTPGTVHANTDYIEDEDSDVKMEREKVQAIFDQDTDQSQNCVMAASGLRKEFQRGVCYRCCGKTRCCKAPPVKVAVRNLSMSVKEGEVMGLLGPNGAGKSTSMNVITADIKATCGQVQIAGSDIASSLSEAFRVMGYCPQYDPLYDSVTVREHIQIYGLIKGIHPDDIQAVADHYMEGLNISEHANKKSQELSGGTKRKLCFAISMLGKPKIVFLDEPSTGMDPSSKRFLWNTIIASFRGDQGAILTTHSMEEADAVCSRVGIMVLGKLMCLGTTQHLKSKYGSGYSLEVKLNPGQAYYSMDHTSGQATDILKAHLAALDRTIREMFPRAEVTETFGERVIYKIPSEEVSSLSMVFAALEQGKETLHIEEYSFSQATLEQVFLEFAKIQTKSDEEEDVQSSRWASRTKSKQSVVEAV